jgi:hypothetical protein
MRTIVLLFLFGGLGLAHAEDNAPRLQGADFTNRLATIAQYATPRQDWVTNYFGKTLSCLGEIDTIRITGRVAESPPGQTHQDLWRLIEESQVQDYGKGSHFVGVRPTFTIEYVGGLRVQGDRYNVLIMLPDGRKCSAWLRPRPDKP